jgi:hypothetical protein
MFWSPRHKNSQSYCRTDFNICARSAFIRALSHPTIPPKTLKIVKVKFFDNHYKQKIIGLIINLISLAEPPVFLCVEISEAKRYTNKFTSAVTVSLRRADVYKRKKLYIKLATELNKSLTYQDQDKYDIIPN